MNSVATSPIWIKSVSVSPQKAEFLCHVLQLNLYQKNYQISESVVSQSDVNDLGVTIRIMTAAGTFRGTKMTCFFDIVPEVNPSVVLKQLVQPEHMQKDRF